MPATTYTPSQDLASGEGVVSDSVTVLSGQVLLKGAVLGKITASGKYVLSLTASADGSETPYAYLLEDTDATTGDITNVPIRIAGQVVEPFLIYGTGHTEATVKPAFREVGLFIKSAIGA